jgi:hypothetical protein
MSASAEAVASELGFFCVGLNHETSPLEVRDALVSPTRKWRGPSAR